MVPTRFLTCLAGWTRSVWVIVGGMPAIVLALVGGLILLLALFFGPGAARAMRCGRRPASSVRREHLVGLAADRDRDEGELADGGRPVSLRQAQPR